MPLDELDDAVVLMAADDLRGPRPYRGYGIVDRDSLVGRLEQLEIVDLIAESHETPITETAQADELAHGLILTGPSIVHGQPVPTRRVRVLENMELDGAAEILADAGRDIEQQ